MKLYVSHASNYDYQTELYEPLKRALANHEVFYPHDPENDGKYSKDILEASDFILADVSQPSTGQGIELGWANAAGVKIICFYKSDVSPSGAVKHVAQELFSYSDQQELVERIASIF